MESMNHQQCSSGFEYSDLLNAATHIRLIRVTKAEEGKTVHCEITTWLTELTPPYSAISYTWGDPANTKVIIVNGKETTVRLNCEYVLRQSYWHDEEGYIWIDALCINQGDHSEKNVQVAMMGEIYQRAERVLACVGPHADDSEYLLRHLRQNEQFYASIPERTSLEWTSPGVYNDVCRWLLLYSPFSLERLSQAHGAFFARPYFFRVWVLQELHMAKQITICCGNGRVPFHLLPGCVWTMSKVARLWMHKLLPAPDGFSLLTDLKYYFMWLLARPVGARRSNLLNRSLTSIEIGCKEKKLKVLSFEKNLMRLSGLQCQDPRDMIYATLSLADWRWRSRILPDYSKSCFQLTLEVLGQTPSWYDSSILSLSEWLVENLRLRKESSEVATRESLLSPSLRAAPQNLSNPPSTRHHRIQGTPYRLVSQKSEPGLYIHLKDNKSSTASLLGPALQVADTREGDLVVFLNWLDATTHFNWMLVAREIYGKDVQLIGYTAFEHASVNLAKPYWDEVEVYLDSEDLLMFAVLDNSLQQLWESSNMTVEGNRELSQLLARRVCRYAESSFGEWRYRGGYQIPRSFCTSCGKARTRARLKNIEHCPNC